MSPTAAWQPDDEQGTNSLFILLFIVIRLTLHHGRLTQRWTTQQQGMMSPDATTTWKQWVCHVNHLYYPPPMMATAHHHHQ